MGECSFVWRRRDAFDNVGNRWRLFATPPFAWPEQAGGGALILPLCRINDLYSDTLRAFIFPILPFP
jgi:hypothetical protein